jgi:hypothetical protein
MSPPIHQKTSHVQEIARCRPPGQPDRGRQGPAGAPGADLPAGRRPSADRGRAGRRQDHAGACAGHFAGPEVQPRAVHQRPAAGRRGRHLGLRAREERLRVPSRPDLHPGAAGRRNQPRHAEDPVRPARSDGRAPGHRRRRHARAARTVLRHRHPEPGAPGGHLPAARIAARPLPDVPVAGLPGRRRRTRAADGRRPAQHAQALPAAMLPARADRRPAARCARSMPRPP